MKLELLFTFSRRHNCDFLKFKKEKKYCSSINFFCLNVHSLLILHAFLMLNNSTNNWAIFYSLSLQTFSKNYAFSLDEIFSFDGWHFFKIFERNFKSFFSGTRNVKPFNHSEIFWPNAMSLNNGGKKLEKKSGKLILGISFAGFVFFFYSQLLTFLVV